MPSIAEVFYTYICLINEGKPSNKADADRAGPFRTSIPLLDEKDENVDDVQTQMGTSKNVKVHTDHGNEPDKEETFYDSVSDFGGTGARSSGNTSAEDIGVEPDLRLEFEDLNPNILNLTRMKWLSDGQNGAVNATCLPSTASSSSSYCSISDEVQKEKLLSNHCLSTILKLDKEHNLFGLSHITIADVKSSKASQKKPKKDEKAVFHQEAIVQQICCENTCCKHMSKTGMPSSLKCGMCARCCMSPCCRSCSGGRSSPFKERCRPCRVKPCKLVCPPSRCCGPECFKIEIKRKFPDPLPPPVVVEPRSSCILHKPLAARTCNHWPKCVPPSSCFQCVMPCFWPGREGAPCTDPRRCFHNPPCPPPRIPKRRLCLPPCQGSISRDICPKKHVCNEKGHKCQNQACLGASRKKCSVRNCNINQHKKKSRDCECQFPLCVNCFVYRPSNTRDVGTTMDGFPPPSSYGNCFFGLHTE